MEQSQLSYWKRFSKAIHNQVKDSSGLKLTQIQHSIAKVQGHNSWQSMVESQEDSLNYKLDLNHNFSANISIDEIKKFSNGYKPILVCKASMFQFSKFIDTIVNFLKNIDPDFPVEEMFFLLTVFKKFEEYDYEYDDYSQDQNLIWSELLKEEYFQFFPFSEPCLGLVEERAKCADGSEVDHGVYSWGEMENFGVALKIHKGHLFAFAAIQGGDMGREIVGEGSSEIVFTQKLTVFMKSFIKKTYNNS